jgi:hypothetical protein
MGQLETQRLHDLVAEEPAASDERATATKQYCDDDANDKTSIAFLGGFGANGHFIHFVHDFFSL